MRRLIVAGSLLIVAGCAPGVSGGSSPMPSPSVPEPPATSEETTESAAGNVPKSLGEPVLLGPGTPTEETATMRFTVDAITPNPECGEFGVPPEQGFFYRVDVTVETRAGHDPNTTLLDAGTAAVVGPDGFTDSAVATAASYQCLDMTETLPPVLAADSRYEGSFVIDSKYDAGTLLLRPSLGSMTAVEYPLP